MAGHNKWSQIKRKKEVTDAKKSQVFSKLARLITLESRKAGGDLNSPGLRAVIEKARSYNMPGDNIERAVKKGVEKSEENLEAIIYEAYGPGGVALIIEALTGNRNKAASEIKHILSENDASLGAIGSTLWAFTKTREGWLPQTTIEVSPEDKEKIETLCETLEDNEEVQEVYTNLKN